MSRTSTRTVGEETLPVMVDAMPACYNGVIVIAPGPTWMGLRIDTTRLYNGTTCMKQEQKWKMKTRNEILLASWSHGNVFLVPDT